MVGNKNEIEQMMAIMGFEPQNRSFTFRCFALALGVVSLAGCSVTTGLDEAGPKDEFSQAISSHEAGLSYSMQKEIGRDQAVVRLRDRPYDMLSLTTRPYRNGFTQRVFYPSTHLSSGENYIDVRVVGEKTKRKPDEKLVLHSSHLGEIFKEAQRALETAAFSFDEENVQKNAYGHFGMIYKKRGGDVGCLFGWQKLHNETKASKVQVVPSDSAGWPARQGLSYRVRYCEAGLSLDDARMVMERIHLKREFGRVWYSGSDAYLDTTPTASIYAPSLPHKQTKPVSRRAPAKTRTAVLTQKEAKPVHFVPSPDETDKPSVASVLSLPVPTTKTTKTDRSSILVPLP